ncbi:F0F1 ATP synthase subunit delta [Marinivivus vitaminiproducens]|uniref:F0F1 ATP synthase subunit delta n=1 Tax=Marinivivus vitaminiproducens TaxID=3035935 RepID=UPI00279DBEEE|nr:F0F1 ATP synthase subunit delta [Geminicoccaceae bacterium SCSIO 64248]
MPAPSASTSGLAERYASALYSLASDNNAVDQVLDDLSKVTAALDGSEDLRRMVGSPGIAYESQTKAILAVADHLGLDDLTRKFLGLIAQQGRLFAVAQIVRAFRERVARERGEVEAEVVSAVPLDDEQTATLRDAVAKFAGKAVSLSIRVDPELIGGLVVRVGSRMIDASLRTKIAQLELSLKGVG